MRTAEEIIKEAENKIGLTIGAIPNEEMKLLGELTEAFEKSNK